MKIDFEGSFVSISEVLWVSPIVDSREELGQKEFEIQFKNAAPTSSITIRSIGKEVKRHPGSTKVHHMHDFNEFHRNLIEELQLREDNCTINGRYYS